MNKLQLAVEDVSGNRHDLVYVLDENAVASAWFKKIKHLYRVPLSDLYTAKIQQSDPEHINRSISQNLEMLNVLIDLDLPVKHFYDQQDCNVLHDITLSKQYSQSQEAREIFHRLHRNIHALEHALQKTVLNQIYAGWGENEGLLTSSFDRLPYDLYVKCVPGNIYLVWSEFGKTPWQYWKDRDLNDRDHFLQTCKPHMTFRAQFSLCVLPASNQFHSNFEHWFDSYRQCWNEKYGCGWIPMYQWGGIPLAAPEKDFNWSTVNTIKSIWPLVTDLHTL